MFKNLRFKKSKICHIILSSKIKKKCVKKFKVVLKIIISTLHSAIQSPRYSNTITVWIFILDCFDAVFGTDRFCNTNTVVWQFFIYSLCSPGNHFQKENDFLFFFTEKDRNRQYNSRIFIGITCN